MMNFWIRFLEFSKDFVRNIYGIINYKFTKMDLYKYIFIQIRIPLYNAPEIKMFWDKYIMFSSFVPRIIIKKIMKKHLDCLQIGLSGHSTCYKYQLSNSF